MPDPTKTENSAPARVIIAGGGIAGIEALLALVDLAGPRAAITLLAPVPDFTVRPQIVEEAFTGQPAEAHELEPLVAEAGASFVRQGLAGVDGESKCVILNDGSRLDYDALVICIGAPAIHPFNDVITFEGGGASLHLDSLLDDEAGDVTFVVPPGTSWPLPVYELALMTERRKSERGLTGVSITVVTPEPSPLSIFGSAATNSVAALFEARGISVQCNSSVRQTADGELLLMPGGRPLKAGHVVTVPINKGPSLPGVPADPAGYIPIDQHCRVNGLNGVYAAGDCTTFPVKQGGIGTQLADAAIEHLAAELGAPLAPKPFTPVLRGLLFTGPESLSLRHTLTGGAGEGSASSDSLWWPPLKVSGRYLSAWLAGTTPRTDVEPPERGIEIEVSLPHEWHAQPMAMDSPELMRIGGLPKVS